MQRLEQLHVIPDTLPTLVPEADVKVKFSHNVEHEFRDWIAPGSILPTFAVENLLWFKCKSLIKLKVMKDYTLFCWLIQILQI